VEKFYRWARTMSPSDRGDLLGGFRDLEEAADQAALTGQVSWSWRTRRLCSLSCARRGLWKQMKT
jgi:hypothetical protein